jgi:hypothetical protein
MGSAAIPVSADALLYGQAQCNVTAATYIFIVCCTAGFASVLYWLCGATQILGAMQYMYWQQSVFAAAVQYCRNLALQTHVVLPC